MYIHICESIDQYIDNTIQSLILIWDVDFASLNRNRSLHRKDGGEQDNNSNETRMDRNRLTWIEN